MQLGDHSGQVSRRSNAKSHEIFKMALVGKFFQGLKFLLNQDIFIPNGNILN